MGVLENPRYEKYVQLLIAGNSQRKAYRGAFKQASRWKDETIDNKASKLFKTDEVKARYQELQEQAQDEAILTRKERMVSLSDIARGAEKEADMIKAIDTLNKMDGLYIQKTEITGNLNIANTALEIEEYLNGDSS